MFIYEFTYKGIKYFIQFDYRLKDQVLASQNQNPISTPLPYSSVTIISTDGWKTPEPFDWYGDPRLCEPSGIKMNGVIDKAKELIEELINECASE